MMRRRVVELLILAGTAIIAVAGCFGSSQAIQESLKISPDGTWVSAPRW